MSYLDRICARAVGPFANTSVVVPKGLNNNPRSAVIARMEETGDEEENLSAMRTEVALPISRQEAEEEEPEVQRQQSEEGEENEDTPLHRQQAKDEDELAALRRQEKAEDEEVLAPIRRQIEEEEEELAPMRRQIEEGEEEEAIQPMQSIARQEELPLEDAGQTAPPPAHASLEPGAEPVSQELAGEEEPSDLQALHRDFSSVMTQSPQQTAEHGEGYEQRPVTTSLDESFSPSPSPSHPMVPDFPEGIAISNAPLQSTRSDESRPNVVIDQVDVLIHEQALPVDRNMSRRVRDRAIRARYLRRL